MDAVFAHMMMKQYIQLIVIFILKGKQRNEKITSGNTNNENEPCVLLKGVLNNEKLYVLVSLPRICII